MRSELHRLGLRYRLQRRIGDGRGAPTPDLLFSRERVAVFVDGCFWHGCPEHGTSPTTNSGYWTTKIARNQARDLRNNAELALAGWTVVRIWEHEDPAAAALRVRDAVLARR